MPDMSYEEIEAQARHWHRTALQWKDRAALADMYLSITRCAGGRAIVRGYCCPWCGSSDPQDKCNDTSSSEAP